MNPRILHWPVLLATASLAMAQKPGAKPDDAAALEEAIRAVDRAAGKSSPSKKPETAPAAESPVAPPAKPAKPSSGGAAAPGTPATPKPKPADPSDAKPVKPKTPAVIQTQITGLEDAELDNARNLIIFRKNVVVDRPDLKIWCDTLEIALNRRDQAKPAKPAPAKSDEEPDAFGAESIKSATATAPSGGLVVIWRKTESGDVVAVGKKAVYTAADGTFTITGLPEVLRDMSLHFYSPGEADKLVMFKNGSARGSKKQDLNLSAVRAKEIRQRMFSHVPGRRPAEASPAGEKPAAPEPSPRRRPPPSIHPTAGNCRRQRGSFVRHRPRRGQRRRQRPAKSSACSAPMAPAKRPAST
jgi:lipopolysaccharide export system protein LptA